ncbi:MAG TPA: alpha/beta fold hydrolase, partial [Gemmatimonadaceae bacterium]|nr:alpha/beta fold hydrolase [Gemmatimonadaceae bacterium]
MSGTLTLADGACIAFTDGGARDDDALPVVLLHAFPLHRGMWASQLAALGLGRRCVALDFRGFGESTAGARRVTMDQLADDVAALLDHLTIPRAAVVGLSMGGYVAFALLRRHADRVGALVLADTRAAADSAEARDKRAELIALARA